jgi:hypothetical protein
MGSFRSRAFDALDLEIIDRVYEAARAELEAQDPFRDREKDGDPGEALRKRLFALATPGKVDLDTLCNKVLTSMREPSMPAPEPTDKSELAAPVPDADARSGPA